MNKRVLTPPENELSSFSFAQKSYLYSQKKLSPSETDEMKTYLLKNGESARDILGAQLVAQEYLGFISKIHIKVPDISEQNQQKTFQLRRSLIFLFLGSVFILILFYFIIR